ncbi:hypothetical protein ACU68W_09425, partial [Finegoldia sp. P2-F-LR]
LKDEKATQEQVNAAKKALEDAREALDGKKAVDKKPLQAEVDKDAATKADVKYANASDEKKTAYDEALKKA